MAFVQFTDPMVLGLVGRHADAFAIATGIVTDLLFVGTLATDPMTGLGVGCAHFGAIPLGTTAVTFEKLDATATRIVVIVPTMVADVLRGTGRPSGGTVRGAHRRTGLVVTTPLVGVSTGCSKEFFARTHNSSSSTTGVELATGAVSTRFVDVAGALICIRWDSCWTHDLL